MRQERATFHGANAGNLQQFRRDRAQSAPLPIIAHGGAMRFVARLLEQSERG